MRNGGVCLYYKENLPIKERGDLEILDETIVAEIKVKRKKIFFVLYYRHPNQTLEEVNLTMHKLEHIYESIKKENPAVTIICGDYNARSTLFWENDITNWEGRIFGDFLLSNNLEELVNEPTHIRDDRSQSCIDLICSDQPYVLTELGVLPPIDSHSKHNIVHGKLNFKFPSPPPYKRKVWNYRAAKVDLIRDQLDNVNWNDLFHNLNVNEMCILFTDVFLGVMSSNISNKIITCNDKDAPRITTSLKTAIKRNSKVYRKWIQRGRNPTEHQNVRDVQKSTNKLIKQARQTYFTSLGEKLSDPNTGQKSFWTVSKLLTLKSKQTSLPL